MDQTTLPKGRRGPGERRGRARGLAAVIAVALSVVIVDQLTKAWALRILADGAVDLVGSLRLRLVYNTGSAFSLASGLGPVLAVVAAVIVVVLLRAERDVRSAPARLALGAVVGGAVGNLVDRALRAGDGFLGGAVVDFVDLQWWPVFNVADVAITVGAVALALTVGGRDELVAVADEQPMPVER